MALSTGIAAVCREYFGKYDAKRSRWSPANRCDKCPLRQPCMTFGAAPARTIDELHASREQFNREAAEILGKDVQL